MLPQLWTVLALLAASASAAPAVQLLNPDGSISTIYGRSFFGRSQEATAPGLESHRQLETRAEPQPRVRKCKQKVMGQRPSTAAAAAQPASLPAQNASPQQPNTAAPQAQNPAAAPQVQQANSQPKAEGIKANPGGVKSPIGGIGMQAQGTAPKQASPANNAAPANNVASANKVVPANQASPAKQNPPQSKYPAPKFKFGGKTKMRGVNLGGWLLIEKYITPKLLEDAWGAHDQWTYDENAKKDKGIKDRIMKHYAEFVTPDDIKQISDIGLNTVRIPVGYWSFMGGGVNGEPYMDVDVFQFLDPVIERCAELGIAVFIDMHGLPGSQNGQDNSGHSTDQYGWYGNNEWKAKTTEFAVAVAKKYGNGAHGGIVQGIELMNEPKPKWDNGDFDFQKGFFKEAYDAIRKIAPDMTVIYADGWDFPKKGSRWDGFANGQTNIAMDTHIYTLFTPEQSNLGYNARIKAVCDRVEDIKSAESNMPTIIGEWTVAVGGGCGDGDCTGDFDSQRFKDFASKYFAWQTWTFEHATGWTYWNWKMEDAGNAWGLKSGVDKGWLRNIDEMQKQFGEPCKF